VKDGYSGIFNVSGGNHRLLFLIAAVALVITLIVDVSMPFLFSRKVERARVCLSDWRG
jgi:hypothetical protein